MKAYLFIAGIIFIILVNTCSESNSPLIHENRNSDSFIESIHSGCVNLQKTNGDCYLEDHYYKDDTLFLKIHFSANCCPSFIDSSEVLSGSIKIFVHDTLADCRCICDYSDEFKFFYSYQGDTHFEFWQAGLSGEYTLGFKTSF